MYKNIFFACALPSFRRLRSTLAGSRVFTDLSRKSVQSPDTKLLLRTLGVDMDVQPMGGCSNFQLNLTLYSLEEAFSGIFQDENTFCETSMLLS